MTMELDGSYITSPKEEQMSETIIKMQKDDSYLSDVSKGQLAVRYKRYYDQFSTVHELLSKVAISVSRLESENNSLREQNEYLLNKCGLNSSTSKKVNSDAPSAARAAVTLALEKVDSMQAKLVDFEKVALSHRTSTDEAKKENEEIKATLEEVKKDLQHEQKKTVHVQERLRLVEHEYVKEATLRLAAERRLSSLQKEVQDLSDELSAAHCSQQNNHQQSHCDTDHASPVSDNVVITSTPNMNCTYRTGTGTSFPNANATFTRTPPTTNMFQNAFFGMGVRVNKFGNKLKTFIASRKSLQTVQSDVVESIKKMFKSKSPKMPSNYMESMAKCALD